MFGSAARLLAVVVLVVGLVCLPTATTTVEAAPKSKKTASKKESAKKKDSKKSSKTASKKDSKRDTKKSSRTASKKDSKKRGKNEEPRASRSRRVRETPAPKRAPVVARDEDEEEEEEREPAGPRPANRLVADIPTARVVEIQTALIREGVLSGPASGVYDQATFEAMSTFQSRKGYKPVGVPTAYSLRDLGVKKSSGYGQQTAARVLEETAPR
jgi:hypothetical protein